MTAQESDALVFFGATGDLAARKLFPAVFALARRHLRTHLAEVRQNDNGTRQAPFDVLENLKMPATLIEIGFIDNAQEGVELVQPATLRHIADAIADGIEGWNAHPDPGPR